MRKITPETSEKIAIKAYLAYNGYFYYHNLAGLGCFAGIPDFSAIKDGKVYQIECKAKGGKQSPKQREFQEEWEKHGGIYILGGIDEVMRQLKNL